MFYIERCLRYSVVKQQVAEGIARTPLIFLWKGYILYAVSCICTYDRHTHEHRKCTENAYVYTVGGIMKRRKILLSILYLLTILIFFMSMFYLFNK